MSKSPHYDLTPATNSNLCGSFGVRAVTRNKRSLVEFAVELLRVAPATPTGFNRNHAHTIWVGGNYLFAVVGFRTEAFSVEEVSIVARRRSTTVVLTSPQGNNVRIKPAGPAWRTFFEHLNAKHPQITISRRVWALTNRPNNGYEFFDRL